MPYIYLIIILVLLAIFGFIFGFIQGLKYSSRETKKAKDLANKHLELFKLSIRWIKNPRKIVQYIDECGFKKIGIYGMSYFGDCLQEILRESNFEVVYGVDRNARQLYNPYIPIYSMNDDLPIVDMIIVTTIVSFPEIKQGLEEKVGRNVPIVSLENILYR